MRADFLEKGQTVPSVPKAHAPEMGQAMQPINFETVRKRTDTEKHRKRTGNAPLLSIRHCFAQKG